MKTLLGALLVVVCACGQVASSVDARVGDGGNVADSASSIDAAPPDGGVDIDAQNTCGNASPDDGEDCDLGVEQNGQSTSCCDSECHFVAQFTICRPAVGACDAIEQCTGNLATCPEDESQPDEASCSEGGDTCCSGECVTIGGSCDCYLPDTPTLVVTVVESQSYADWATMDETWRDQALAMGHAATIVPQETLDDIANLAATDVLIVPSGVIDLPEARVATIQAFVASGRGAFLQAEYLNSFTPNAAYASIVNALGGSFAWTTELTGQLAPVDVVGCVGTYPETVPTISEFYYGVTGTAGTGVSVLVSRQTDATPLGFSFCRTGGGMLMTTSDGDFVRNQNPVEFMTNVITRLAHADICG